MILRRDHIDYKEPPEASGLSIAQVEDVADRFALAVGYQPGGPLEPIVERLSGRLCYDLPDDEDGSVFVHESNDFDIALSHWNLPTRNRFTLCHELGHYVLHSLFGEQPIIAHRKGSGRIEWEANWFAAALLMPRTAFTDRLNGGATLADIALEFNVSLDAARVRNERLKPDGQ